MKKFLRYATLILLLFVSFSFVLTGCGKKKDPDYDAPKADARVYGNGGLAVTKGDYLYFLNGYRTYADVTKEEKKLSNHENVVRGAIYRTKLSATGDLTVDEDGKIVSSSVERVVDQIACFENGGLYIVGDYIYYATPNTQDDRTGKLLNNYVDYCRVSLSDPSDREVLYTSDGEVTSGEWHVYGDCGDIFLVIKSSDKVVCVKNDNDAYNMITDFTDVKFWANEDGHALKDHEKYVYYTRAIKDGEITSGNVVARVKLGSSDEDIIKRDGSTITLKELKNDKIYYTNSDGKLRVVTPTFGNVNGVGDKALTQKSYDKMYVVENNEPNATLNRVLVYEAAKEGNAGTLVYYDNGSWEKTVVVSANMEILEVEGNYVYYYDSDNSGIYRVDIVSKVVTKLTNGDAINFSTTQNMKFDVDVNYMYFLNGYSVNDTTVYYLERVDMTYTNPSHTFVGQFVDGEAPVEEEEEESADSETK